MQKMLKEWQNTTDAMEDATARWTSSTIDGFVDMVRTGKFEWKSLVADILADLLKIELRKSVGSALGGLFSTGVSVVKGLFGFADGGIMTSSGAAPLRKYATGGIANSPQLALYGEGSRPEAYVPLPDGRTIPVTMQGGAGNVVVNVINQTGTQVAAKQSQPRFDGKQMVLDVVLEGVSKPGPFRDSMKSMMKG
jgi:phage-related minor tail protein